MGVREERKEGESIAHTKRQGRGGEVYHVKRRGGYVICGDGGWTLTLSCSKGMPNADCRGVIFTNNFAWLRGGRCVDVKKRSII